MGLIDSRRVERLIERVRATRKNCDFADVERMLLSVGCTERRPGGSHNIFKCPGFKPISVPKHKPVKEHYVDKALRLVEVILGTH